MAVIKRGIGRSPTEKNLAALADNIFLNLWTYPNLFKRDGKELCDVLVVCGDDVLIFSDKNIAWQKGDDFGLSWSRWYRRAIEESAAQINGAARYLREHPDELFLDAACKEKFPLALPPLDRRRLHHIAVALGASEACTENYKVGYFPINPDLKGASHIDTTVEDFARFAIGDVQPEDAFIHVLNESALELLARELDTVTDFVRYLTRRERIIRSGHLLALAGEHDLLGHYLLSGGPDEDHDFRPADGREWRDGERLQIPSGMYAGLAQQPGYQARNRPTGSRTRGTIFSRSSRRQSSRAATRRNEPIEPMTLGNMRGNGVRSLDVCCWIYHHRVVLSAERWPGDVPVPSFGPRMVCTNCGIVGADARPH
jgi:hypothetical protein